jgi:hypothetical protein
LKAACCDAVVVAALRVANLENNKGKEMVGREGWKKIMTKSEEDEDN